MARIFCVANQKGGVGKTTTALNLAAALIRTGRTAYGIDLDPQAHLSSISGITVRSGDETMLSLFQRNRPLREMIQDSVSGIGIIPSHIELSKVDALYGKGYNAINKLNLSLQAEKTENGNMHWIIDCSPLVGVLSLNAIFACDGVIVPMSADYLSFKGAIQIQKTLKALERVLKRRVNRRYLLTRFDSRRRMAKDVRGIGALDAVALFALTLCQRAADQFHGMVHIKRLGQILERAALERGHRALQIGISRHDDHRQRGIFIAQGLQQIETGTARHADVADHHLRLAVRQLGQRLVGRGETLVFDLFARQCFFQHPADGAVIVDDPDRFAHYCFSMEVSGSMTVKQVRPGSLSNSILP